MSDIADTIHKLHTELPPDVTLVAVSKFHPVAAVVEAYRAGQRVFGESRPQELLSKVLALRESASASGNPESYSDIRWHFIGHLQTNKLKMVLPYVSMVESVADEIREILFSGTQYSHVRIRGLMGMATFTDNESVIREDFSRLVTLRDGLLPEAGRHPNLHDGFGILSFGMTHDYKIAVSMGAGIVRIGTLIFGERNY